MYIDTHCHLDLFENIHLDPQKENRSDIKTISVTNLPSFYQANLKLFKECENIRVALGFHPELVKDYHSQFGLFEELIKTTRYIGEIGLDGSKDFKSTYELQVDIFLKILRICKREGNKVLSIHSRNASSDVVNNLISILDSSSCKVILHWYTGELKDLEKAVDAGFYFSVNHKMVKSKNGISIIESLPRNLILTETDAPFTLFNSNYSRIDSIKNTINSLALIWKMSCDDCAKIVYNNFKNSLS